MTQKQLIATIVASLTSIATALTLYFGLNQDPTTPEPTPDPPPSEEVRALILDSLVNPWEAQDSDWSQNVSKKVLLNEPTGFVLKTDSACDLVGESNLHMIMPIAIQYPSAIEYSTGTAYDALMPLEELNCNASPYVWVEFPQPSQRTILGAQMSVEAVNAQAAEYPVLPLMMAFNNWTMIQGYCGGYCNAETNGKQGTQLLKDHRIQPYDSNVVPYNGWDVQPFSFREYSAQYQDPDRVQFPLFNASNSQIQLMGEDATANAVKGWFYVMDEPAESQIPALKDELRRLRTLAPNIKRMVTTSLRSDLNQVDIFAPVAEHLGPNYPQPSDYQAAGKRLWMYVSCMSNGCGPNRAWNGGAIEHVDYNRSGAPDLAIDAPLLDTYAFYLVGYTLGVESLLYYNSIEGWALYAQGIDVWQDQYNFGLNGDGTLLYPDRERRMALPSLRLKMLREASFLIDAATLAGAGAELRKLVGNSMTYERDPAAYKSVRELVYGGL